MLVLMIVFCFRRKMLTSSHVLVVKNQGGKEMRHLLLQKMLHPIKGRRKLQRSYGGSMKWHVNSRTDDGVMRHHADLDAWKMFDSKHLEFLSDPIMSDLD